VGRKEQLKRRAAMREAYDPALDAYRDHWSGVPLDGKDRTDPFHMGFDHMAPIRSLPLVIGSGPPDLVKARPGPKKLRLDVDELDFNGTGPRPTCRVADDQSRDRPITRPPQEGPSIGHWATGLEGTAGRIGPPGTDVLDQGGVLSRRRAPEGPAVVRRWRGQTRQRDRSREVTALPLLAPIRTRRWPCRPMMGPTTMPRTGRGDRPAPAGLCPLLWIPSSA